MRKLIRWVFKGVLILWSCVLLITLVVLRTIVTLIGWLTKPMENWILENTNFIEKVFKN